MEEELMWEMPRLGGKKIAFSLRDSLCPRLGVCFVSVVLLTRSGRLPCIKV